MAELILHYPHRRDGEIRLERIDNEVKLQCRWPFDLATDEWIYLSNNFAADEYAREVNQLREKRTVRIRGLKNGALVLTVQPDGRVEIDATDSRNSAPPRLIEILNVSPEGFALRHAHSS